MLGPKNFFLLNILENELNFKTERLDKIDKQKLRPVHHPVNLGFKKPL
jgi:hypothetical protein